MSILIKDYEMPESCRECPVEMYYIHCGETRCRATNRILASDFKTIAFEGRADDCPLTDVPDINDGDTISRQTALNALYGLSLGETDALRLYYRMHDYLKKLPSAPERVGHWIERDEYYECSRCGLAWVLNDGTPKENEMYYCPKCKAHMIEEVDG